MAGPLRILPRTLIPRSPHDQFGRASAQTLFPACIAQTMTRSKTCGCARNTLIMQAISHAGVTAVGRWDRDAVQPTQSTRWFASWRSMRGIVPTKRAYETAYIRSRRSSATPLNRHNTNARLFAAAVAASAGASDVPPDASHCVARKTGLSNDVLH